MTRLLLLFCCVLCFSLLFVGFFHPINAINDDLGRHLLFGKIIAQTTDIPKTNLISYTYPSYPFINSHWLSEVIFYLVHRHAGGFNGLLLISSIITLISFFLIFRYTAKNYSFTATILAAILMVPILVFRTDIRPEIFSFLLLPIFLIILYHHRSKSTKWLYALIPLELLWVNLHIYFIVGIMIIMLFLLDSLLTKKLHTNRFSLITILIFAIIITIVNPNGLSGAMFPLTVFQDYGLPVIENQNVFTIQTLFQQTQVLYGVFIIGLVLLLLFINKRQTRPIDWLLVIFFSIAALLAIRNFPLFVYAGFIPLVMAVNNLLPQVSHKLIKHTSRTYSQILTTISLMLCTLLLFATITEIIDTQGLGFGVDERAKSAADFFIEHKLHGRLYNNFDIGSYLAYRLYPKEKVFVDGRPEAYPETFFRDIYIPMQQNPEFFSEIAANYQFNVIFLTHWDQTPTKNALLTSLLNSPNYSFVYLDDYAVIFVRKSKIHNKLVKNYTITENTFRLDTQLTYDSLVRYLYFFKKAGWTKRERDIQLQLQKFAIF